MADNLITLPLDSGEWKRTGSDASVDYSGDTLTAYRTGGSGAVPFTVTWGWDYPDLGGSPTPLHPADGQTYVLTATVTANDANTSNGPVTVSLGYGVLAGWNVDYHPLDSAELQPGESDTVELVATMPPEAEGVALQFSGTVAATALAQAHSMSAPVLEEGEPPEPDPEPWVEVAGSVITITDAPPSTEYTLETEDEQHQHTLTTDEHGAGSFDAAEWGLPPGDHTVTITGPYLAEAVLVTIEPDDDDDDEHDRLAAALAPRVAAYVGRAGDEQAIATAAGQIPIVAEFVAGYTRGKGWNDGQPAAPLRAVIVSATGRLVLNPEQVRQYSAGDYSETPAILTAFTLAEQHILNRYRRRWA